MVYRHMRNPACLSITDSAGEVNAASETESKRGFFCGRLDAWPGFQDFPDDFDLRQTALRNSLWMPSETSCQGLFHRIYESQSSASFYMDGVMFSGTWALR